MFLLGELSKKNQYSKAKKGLNNNKKDLEKKNIVSGN